MKYAKNLLLAVLMASAPAIASACTVFMWSDGKISVFGNNEDSPVGEESVFIFVPASGTTYGYFQIKSPTLQEPFVADYPQGGMNEKGLAFDITATPLIERVEVNIPPATPYSGGNLMEQVLRYAATVDEAVAMIEKYKASENIRKAAGISEFRQMQVLLADRSGGAAVIGVGPDGNLAVTRKTGKYLVVTNFSLVQPANSAAAERMRYETAEDMLKDQKKVSAEYIRSLLSAVHVEGMAATLYSTIYDLKTLEISVYNFHDYEYVKKLNLRDELKKGVRVVPLAEFFKDRPLFSLRSMKETVDRIKQFQEKYMQTRKEADACAKPEK